MQVKDKSHDRLLVRLIREICAEENIEMTLLSHGWLIELKKDGKTKRILGFTFDLNSSIASGIMQDKVATYELLAAYNVPAVPHYIARTNYSYSPTQKLAWAEGVVIKPIHGWGGEDVRLFRSGKKARRCMESAREVAWALSPLQDMLREVRVILLDGKVLHVYAKQPAIINGLRVFNLSKGAEPIYHLLTESQEKLAHRAQKTLDARLCAVDIAELANGELKVLEVNGSISMERYAAYSTENLYHAKNVYRKIVTAMLS